MKQHIDGWWRIDHTMIERLAAFAEASVGHSPKTVKKEFRKYFTGKFDDGGSVKGRVSYNWPARTATFTIHSDDIPDASGSVCVG